MDNIFQNFRSVNVGSCSCRPLGVSLLALLPTFAHAEGQFQDRVPEFQSGHSLGMGGTSVSFARGLDAVFENPAGISQSKNILSEAVLVSPMVTAGEEGKKLYNDINAGTDALEMVQKYSNKPQHVSVQNVTGIAFKRAAIGFLQRGQVDILAGSDPYSGIPTAEVRADARAGLYLASSREFLGESLMFGLTTKLVQKRELSISKNVFEVQSDLKGKSSKSVLNENMRQGMAVGADIGTIYRIKEMDTKPAFGVVARNIGMDYGIGVPQGKDKPKKDPMVVDVGVSLEPGTRKSMSRLAVDFVDAFNTQKQSPFKRIHVGAELSFQNIVGFTAGLGQGYPSYGGYLNIKIVRLEAGMYGAEMGKQSGDLMSRRCYGRVSVGWLE